jgi:hypothetical protein
MADRGGWSEDGPARDVVARIQAVQQDIVQRADVRRIKPQGEMDPKGSLLRGHSDATMRHTVGIVVDCLGSLDPNGPAKAALVF